MHPAAAGSGRSRSRQISSVFRVPYLSCNKPHPAEPFGAFGDGNLQRPFSPLRRHDIGPVWRISLVRELRRAVRDGKIDGFAEDGVGGVFPHHLKPDLGRICLRVDARVKVKVVAGRAVGHVHGKPVTKVYIEEVTPAVANLLETIDMWDNPTIIAMNGVNEVAGKAWMGMDTRAQRSADAMTGGVGVVYRPQTLELGNAFRSALSNIGPGFGAQVADFGDAITVTITYSNAKTGRCASQSYVVLWQPDRNPKYPYKVMSSVARYRNCADYGQAIGFIRSKASGLPGSTGSLL